MGILMRIIGCVACLFVAYMATMAWVNVNEGEDAFAGTPLEGRVDSAFAKKAVDFTSEQLEKLSQETKQETRGETKGESQKAQYVEKEEPKAQELATIQATKPQVEESTVEALPEPELKLAPQAETKLAQVEKAKPTAEDALEKLWGIDNAKSSDSKINTSTSASNANNAKNADASLMDSLERLMN